MTEYLDQPLYFDDVEVGDTWQSPARTITEADITNFAALTGDYNPLHVDHAFARTTHFGRPIAHGLLGLSYLAGLCSHSPHMATLAFVRIHDWKFLQPIYVGDTVRAHTELIEKGKKRKRRGLLIWRRKLINSETGIVVQDGNLETLVMTRQSVD